MNKYINKFCICGSFINNINIKGINLIFIECTFDVNTKFSQDMSKRESAKKYHFQNSLFGMS